MQLTEKTEKSLFQRLNEQLEKERNQIISAEEKRLFLGSGVDDAFLRQVTAFIAHPMETKDKTVREDYFCLLTPYERNIFAALAIHCGKKQVAEQMMTEDLSCALKADAAESEVRDCMLGYVPELMTEHMDYMSEMTLTLIMRSKSFTRPLRDCTCHCSATIEELK